MIQVGASRRRYNSVTRGTGGWACKTSVINNDNYKKKNKNKNHLEGYSASEWQRNDYKQACECVVRMSVRMREKSDF